ncbi:MAG: hypothetical protein ACYC4B_29440 [Pirellulaceae bacterium]
MSTIIPTSDTGSDTRAAQRLRALSAAVRLNFTWLGVRKSLSADQTAQAADAFGAQRQYLSAGKKLLDTQHPAFKAVTAVRSRILGYWKGMSLPYPEPGIRLIRQDRVDTFHAHMEELRGELQEAVRQLNEHYGDLTSAARERLGSLYNPADYPPTLEGLFHVAWDFPSVEPPDYLRQLHPDIFAQECQRMRQRFDEAVQLAEQAFTEELSQLVSHLTERLSGQADGKSKIFRDSMITNLTEFFQRFRRLNIRSSEQLDQLVDQCQSVERNVEPQLLRDNQGLRQAVVQELSRVQGALDTLLVDRPRRNILRRPR